MNNRTKSSLHLHNCFRKIPYANLETSNTSLAKPFIKFWNFSCIKDCHCLNWRKSKQPFVSLIVIVLIIFVIFYSETISTFKSTLSDSFGIYNSYFQISADSDACEIPKLDPWDPSIAKYLQKPGPLNCNSLQADITYLDGYDGKLYFNETELIKNQYSKSNLPICQYRCFDRNTSDFHLIYEQWIVIKNNETDIMCEFIDVRCYTSFLSPLPFYRNTHNQAIVKNFETKFSTVNTQKKKLPSVLLFVIDSMSNSNWKRNLPKTLKVLLEQYNSTVFDGFVKIGENSFPNAISFLTGKKYENAHPRELPLTLVMDNWPLIWYEYKQKGYSTYYAEDFKQYNLFTFNKKGFTQKPTNNYFRPFWMHVDSTMLHKRSSPYCYGNNKRYLLQLNYLKQYLKKNNRLMQDQYFDEQNNDDFVTVKHKNKPQKIKGQPIFALNWLSEQSHNYLNKISQADDDFANFFTEMKEELKNSFVFVFGDHGQRIDPIRQTLVGRIEGQMPFFSMHVPNWLYTSYPQLRSVIEKNSKRLTTFWDVYITLKDILDLADNNFWAELNSTQNFIKKGNKFTRVEDLSDSNITLIRNQPVERFQNYSKRGLSLLRPLPLSRSCASTDIPQEYCVCQREVSVHVDNPLVTKAAQKTIDFINLKIKQGNVTSKCAKLKVKSLISAQLYLPNFKMLNSKYPNRKAFSLSTFMDSKLKLNYRIVVVAEPSDGVFEAVVQNNMENNVLQVLGSVDRINRYGNQSICVDTSKLRQYCYCI